MAVIEGHTDNQGNANWNLKLSEQRAQCVKQILARRYHIAPERITTIGYGEERPVADNWTWLGRKQNRRVSVVVSNAPIGYPPTIRVQWGASFPNPAAAPRTRIAAPNPPLFLAHPQESPLKAQRKAVVLCYHGFDMRNNRYSITSDAFERQINSMLNNGYTIISIETLTRFLDHKQDIPPKSVVITIDDGWKSAMRAFAILKRHDLPFTLFLAMHYVGHPNSTCLNASDIEQLKQYPKVTFANHSFSHSPRFLSGGTSASYEAFIRKDIEKSQLAFREMFGTTSPYFAFPFGARNKKLIQILQEAGFSYLFSVGSKPVTAQTNLTDIQRYGGHNLNGTTLARIFTDGSPNMARKSGRRNVSSGYSGTTARYSGDILPLRGMRSSKQSSEPSADRKNQRAAVIFQR